MLTVVTQARIPAPVLYSGLSLPSLIRFSLRSASIFSLRSRLSHKAWGVSPRFKKHERSSPRSGRQNATKTWSRFPFKEAAAHFMG